MAEPDILYKIIVLDLLQKSPVSLSNSTLTAFFQENEYTDYFTVQLVINNLQDNQMIVSESDNNTTIYSITEEGTKTLKLFNDRITPGIAEDIKKFLIKNKVEIIEEASVSADYDRSSEGGYIVHMRYLKNGKVIMDFSLNVPSVDQAKSICNNWKVRPEEVYAQLMDVLL